MDTAPLLAIAYGDGVGHEIMEAALLVVREAGARLSVETVRLGDTVYKMGSGDGVAPSAWPTLERARILLKAPTSEYAEKETATHAICRYFEITDAAAVTKTCAGYPHIAANAYIGERFALFEPVQNADVDIAVRGRAHPAAMILAASMALTHLGQAAIGDKLCMALEKALKKSRKKVKTTHFADAVMEALTTPLPV